MLWYSPQVGRKTASNGPPQPNGKVVIEEDVEDHTDATLVRTGRSVDKSTNVIREYDCLKHNIAGNS